MKKYVLLVLIVLICAVTIIPTFTYADSIKPDEYKKIYTNSNENKSIKEAGEKVLGVVKTIAISIGVIFLIIIGIKYIMMSTNAADKASIKEKLIPYVIGAVLVFSTSGILTIITKFAYNMKK